MITLGVDPGSRFTGYGILENKSNKFTVLGAGVIRLDKIPDMPEKLLQLHQSLEKLIQEFKPTSGAVETQFHGVNVRSAFMIGQVRGAVLLTFAEHGISCGEYPPATIKKTVTGNGQASKEQVSYMLSRLTGAQDLEKSHDAADALGIAFTHLQRHSEPQNL